MVEAPMLIHIFSIKQSIHSSTQPILYLLSYCFVPGTLLGIVTKVSAFIDDSFQMRIFTFMALGETTNMWVY